MRWIAPGSKETATATPEERLWIAAEELRGAHAVSSAALRHPLLGLLFLRFADATFSARRAELAKATTGRRGSRVEDPSAYHAAGTFYLPAEARYDRLLALPPDDTLGRALDDALRAVERYNPQLAGALPKTFHAIEARLGRELLRVVSADLRGEAFEHVLGEFAAADASMIDVHSTPADVARLLVEVVEPLHGRVLDPACGTGGMFVQAARFLAERPKREGPRGLAIHGVEINEEIGRLCRLNLAVHGLEGDIRHGWDSNSYYDDPHNLVGRFDFVLAHPPFHVASIDEVRLKPAVGPRGRFPFGLPGTDNANYLWIQLCYAALNGTGRAGFVMANSASNGSNGELGLRRQLIEARAVDIMVSAGPRMLRTARALMPCTLWFLDRGKAGTRRKDQVLFLDASDVFRQLDRRRRDWTEAQIGFLANVVRLYRGEEIDWTCGGEEAGAKLRELFGQPPRYADVPGLCKVGSIEEIEAQGWSLDPARYVGVGAEDAERPKLFDALPEPTMKSPVEVFISYAEEDTAFHRELVQHLSSLIRDRVIRVSGQDRIPAGTERRAYIEDHLRTAEVILVLVSAGYFHSDPRHDGELKPALEYARTGKKRVMPILVRSFDRSATALAGLEVLPTDDRAVTQWSDRDAAWEHVVTEIRKEIAAPEISARAPRPEPVYESDASRTLSAGIERARARRAALQRAGAPTDEVDAQILSLRRQLREGGQLQAGDTLADGRYLLLKRIGSGGFATVWEAFDERAHERVALKVLHPDLARDPSRRERFFRGARIMASLGHPAVVRVYATEGDDGGYRFFVMELVEGEDLHHAVLGKRLPSERVLPLILSVASALAEAHDEQIIHRDVKPANILLDRAGEPRLTDFDLVAAKDTTGGTRTGALGTFLFTAPEQMTNAKDADARADVYSLAMTAIFCLHGAKLPPYVFRKPERLIATLPCSDAVKAVLTRAIHVAPELRYANAAAFGEALRDPSTELARSESETFIELEMNHAANLMALKELQLRMRRRRDGADDG